jgi:hypothetical protein
MKPRAFIESIEYEALGFGRYAWVCSCGMGDVANTLSAALHAGNLHRDHAHG